jgi:hypothetical protein
MIDYVIDVLTEDDGEWNMLAAVLAVAFWTAVATGTVAFALWASANYSGNVAGF